MDEEELLSNSNNCKIVLQEGGESIGKRGVRLKHIKGGERKITSSSPKNKIIIWILFFCVLIMIGSGVGFIWWRNQPPQIFPFWSEDPSNEPERNGVTLDIFVIRNDDGSGTVKYTFTNDMDVEKIWEVGVWLDYNYKEEFHVITGPYSVPLGKTLYSLSPGEAFSKILELPSGTLCKPGRYRFCAKDVGWKDFVLLNDGTIVVGE